MTLDLYLLRHARTEANDAGRYPAAGDDPPLSPAGRASLGGLRLPDVQQVWSSPARRCRETAEALGYAGPLLTDALREADFGQMAGHTWAELEARYGEQPQRWIEGLLDPASDSGPPGGETGRAFHGRVQSWLDALPDGVVLAFTHAGVVLAALRLTVGLGAARVHPARFTQLRRAGGAWWLEGFNQDG